MTRKGKHELGPKLPDALWDTLRSDEPDPRAIERAYQRFVAPRRPGPARRLGFVRWVAVGLLAGWGLAHAATGSPFFPKAGGAGEGAALGAPSARRLSSTLRARAVALAQTSVNAPPSGAAAVPGARQPTESPPASARVEVVPAISERAALEPQWQRVARALKQRDYAEAQLALAALESGAASDEREAASLALSQVLLAKGRGVEARARLERLQIDARSALVREKARLLLDEISAASQRSAPGSAVTQ
jgi:hypothetical protein